MKKILIVLFLVVVLAGCSNSGITRLEDDISSLERTSSGTETLSTTQMLDISVKETEANKTSSSDPEETEVKDMSSVTSASTAVSVKEEKKLEEKLLSISFVKVSDYFVRNCLQDDVAYKEILITDKKCFMRIGNGDDEEEVFSYNYQTSEFTYLYYFSNELISKVVYNVETEKVTEDEDGLIELVKTDAVLLREYFNDLIIKADIDINEL